MHTFLTSFILCDSSGHYMGQIFQNNFCSKGHIMQLYLVGFQFN